MAGPIFKRGRSMKFEHVQFHQHRMTSIRAVPQAYNPDATNNSSETLSFGIGPPSGEKLKKIDRERKQEQMQKRFSKHQNGYDLDFDKSLTITPTDAGLRRIRSLRRSDQSQTAADVTEMGAGTAEVSVSKDTGETAVHRTLPHLAQATADANVVGVRAEVEIQAVPMSEASRITPLRCLDELSHAQKVHANTNDDNVAMGAETTANTPLLSQQQTVEIPTEQPRCAVGGRRSARLPSSVEWETEDEEQVLMPVPVDVAKIQFRPLIQSTPIQPSRTLFTSFVDKDLTERRRRLERRLHRDCTPDSVCIRPKGSTDKDYEEDVDVGGKLQSLSHINSPADEVQSERSHRDQQSQLLANTQQRKGADPLKSAIAPATYNAKTFDHATTIARGGSTQPSSFAATSGQHNPRASQESSDNTTSTVARRRTLYTQRNNDLHEFEVDDIDEGSPVPRQSLFQDMSLALEPPGVPQSLLIERSDHPSKLITGQHQKAGNLIKKTTKKKSLEARTEKSDDPVSDRKRAAKQNVRTVVKTKTPARSSPVTETMRTRSHGKGTNVQQIPVIVSEKRKSHSTDTDKTKSVSRATLKNVCTTDHTAMPPRKRGRPSAVSFAENVQEFGSPSQDTEVDDELPPNHMEAVEKKLGITIRAPRVALKRLRLENTSINMDSPTSDYESDPLIHYADVTGASRTRSRASEADESGYAFTSQLLPLEPIYPNAVQTPGCRRSKRTRLPRLRHAIGEHAEYGPDGTLRYVHRPKILDPSIRTYGVLFGPPLAERAKLRKQLGVKKRKKTRKTKVRMDKNQLSIHVTDVVEPSTADEEVIVPVVNIDTGTMVGVECFAPNPGTHPLVDADGQPAGEMDSMAISHGLKHCGFSTCILHVRPRASLNGLVTDKLEAPVYFVHSGCIEVVVHGTKRILRPGGTFCVPSGNTYGIRNLRNDEAMLFRVCINRPSEDNNMNSKLEAAVT